MGNKQDEMMMMSTSIQDIIDILAKSETSRVEFQTQLQCEIASLTTNIANLTKVTRSLLPPDHTTATNVDDHIPPTLNMQEVPTHDHVQMSNKQDETMMMMSSRRRGRRSSIGGSLYVCLYDGAGKTLESLTFWMNINLKVKSSCVVPCPYESCFRGPFHHVHCGSAVVGGIMYLIGGMGPNCKHTNNISSMDTTTMDVDPTFYPVVPFDTTTPPRGRPRLSCAYTSNSTSSMDEHLTTHLIVPRHFPCVLTLAKKIYIFGTTWCYPSYNIGPLNLPWGEVLDMESMSIKALAHPPVSSHPVLLKNNVSAYASINDDKQFVFAFWNSDLILLYDVEGDKWTEFYDHPLGRPVDRFMKLCPVINNVLYSYHSLDGYVYAFDLNDNVWFEEPVKFLVKKEVKEVGILVKVEENEVESLYHFKSYKSSSAEGDLHHLGNGLMCAVFLEINGDDSGGHNQLHYVLFTPVVLISSDGLEFSIKANVKRHGCYEVGGWCDYYSSIALPDSVEECVEEKEDESVRTGKQKRKILQKKKKQKIVES